MTHAVAARRLDRVERAVGLPEQAGRVAAVLDQVGDADADGDGPLDALHADRGDHAADRSVSASASWALVSGSSTSSSSPPKRPAKSLARR
jgi:hypothetical protein